MEITHIFFGRFYFQGVKYRGEQIKTLLGDKNGGIVSVKGKNDDDRVARTNYVYLKGVRESLKLYSY